MQKTWQSLQAHGSRLKDVSIGDLFEKNQNRFNEFSIEKDNILYDFSKENIDAAAFDELINLAREAQLESRRDAMFRGEKINLTEGRAVLHMALRGSVDPNLSVDGISVSTAVQEVKDKFLNFAQAVREGGYRTVDERKFTDIVNIGIGGSDLGPAMVTQALTPWHDGPAVHYVSNVDGSHVLDTLSKLDANTTMLIVASKTFTTAETMRNFNTALDWLKNTLGEQADKHLVAISTNLEATRSYGIHDDRVFGFWDWVGGRYSVWSAIGLSVAIAIGKKEFENFLAGAKAMDEHFLSAPLEKNLPVLMALIGVWRRNVMNCPTVALIPYDQYLARLPAYVQQLDMESNGKRTTLDGKVVDKASGPVVWGEPGTNAQHSFFQLIHQGTDIIPVDFLIAAKPSVNTDSKQANEHHVALICNVLAQAQALAFGRDRDAVNDEMIAAGYDSSDLEQLAPHRVFPGNRPSSMLVYPQLTPKILGQVVALFEHKVFVQGVIWNLNSYDQWGVELGKKLASQLRDSFGDKQALENFDASTAGLMESIYRHRS